jgi:hypothetical protein
MFMSYVSTSFLCNGSLLEEKKSDEVWFEFNMKQGYNGFDWNQNYLHPANVKEGTQHQISLKCVKYT